MIPAPETSRHVVGVMTGTSIDGMDAALVRIHGHGHAIRATLLRHLSRTLGPLQQPLRNAANQQPMTAGEFTRLAWEFGRLHADVIDELTQQQLQPDLVCVHGQTVFHQPPHSWQLMNPAPISARFGCPVVSDLRQADLAAGGQGAPITPIADWILFCDAGTSRAIINLGGFCNMTILPRSEEGPAPGRAAASSPAVSPEMQQIQGFDACVCNQLLDAIARDVLEKPFDENGEAAFRGRAKPQAVEELTSILARQHKSKRSLGTGDEAMAWLKSQRATMSGDDIAASAVDAIASVIAQAARDHSTDELILAGGGARNRALVAAIARHAGLPTRLSDELGVPIDAREAMEFAVLGALCADGVPITLPQVTGCTELAPLSGVWSLPCVPLHSHGHARG